MYIISVDSTEIKLPSTQGQEKIFLKKNIF